MTVIHRRTTQHAAPREMPCLLGLKRLLNALAVERKSFLFGSFRIMFRLWRC